MSSYLDWAVQIGLAWEIYCSGWFCPELSRTKSFADVDEGLDSITEKKAFRSSFVLQLLAHAHLRACSGSINVPALNLSVKEYQARGAIVLCVSAVSCFSITVLLILTH